MSEQLGVTRVGDRTPALFYSLPLGGAEMGLDPGSSCFGPGDPEFHRLPMDGTKMAAVARVDGWLNSDLGAQVNAKQDMSGLRGQGGYEPGFEGQGPRRMDGRLDSFDEAFAHRRSLGQRSSAGSCAQAPTLRQMLQRTPSPQYMHVRAGQSPHYRPPEALPPQCGLSPARRMAVPQPAMQLAPQQQFLQHLGAALHQQQRMTVQGKQECPAVRYQQLQEGREALTDAGTATHFLYGARQHCHMQEQQRDALVHLYHNNGHASPVHTPQPPTNTSPPQYVTSCAQQDPGNVGDPSCIQLLNSSSPKHLTSHICPTDIYWEQVHQTPPSCSRLTSQRRGMEEEEELSYPYICGSCKEQFRNVASFQAHSGPEGCIGTSHTVNQDVGQKVLRDSGHLSPHLSTNAMAMKATAGEDCGRDALLSEGSGDFLSGQEMTLLDNMADYSTPESAEGFGRKYTSVAVYRSCLRPDNSHGRDPLSPHNPSSEPPHYTPQPMLNPQRKSTGLFTNLRPSSTDHVSTIAPFPGHQFNGFDYVAQDFTDTGDSRPPCINVGPRFQAAVPELPERLPVNPAAHGADLVWKPWAELLENQEKQKQVEDLLNVACSSALPGGGSNREFALHCLSEAEGDIMVALESLLLNNGARSPSHLLAGYHYSGSTNWSSSERRLFNKAFTLHKKDFRAVHKMVKTKLVAECVEYYYTFKKSLKFNKKLRPRASDADEDWNSVFRQDTDYELLLPSPQSGPPVHRGESPCPTVIGNFPCKQCGKMFYKIKSRNAHMKIHRQQDDWQHRSQEALCPPATYTGAALGKPTATPHLYPNWDNRGLPGQLDLLPETVTCSGLPPLYHQDGKLTLTKAKCNYFL